MYIRVHCEREGNRRRESARKRSRVHTHRHRAYMWSVYAVAVAGRDKSSRARNVYNARTYIYNTRSPVLTRVYVYADITGRALAIINKTAASALMRGLRQRAPLYFYTHAYHTSRCSRGGRCECYISRERARALCGKRASETF